MFDKKFGALVLALGLIVSIGYAVSPSGLSQVEKIPGFVIGGDEQQQTTQPPKGDGLQRTAQPSNGAELMGRSYDIGLGGDLGQIVRNEPETTSQNEPGSTLEEVDCIVDEIADMGNRVHVHCYRNTVPNSEIRDSGGNIIEPSPFDFYALPLDSPHVATFMIMAQAVQNYNHYLQLHDFCAEITTLMTSGSAGCKPSSDWINGYIGPIGGAPSTLHIWYDEKDTSGTSFGCEADSCRVPQAFKIVSDWKFVYELED
jgi:hypothetical protein